MAFVLKTSCNGDLRRVLIDPVAGFKYGQLRSLLQNQFPKLKKSCVTHYVDDEKDLIRIASDAELVEAFRVAKNMGLKSLKIVVSEESKNNNAVKTTQGASAPEPEKKKEPPVLHYGFTCDVSGESPIAGPRFHKKGTNFDLCGAEFEKLTFADQVAFEKIEKPSDPSRRGWWHHKKVSAEAAAFFSREKKAAIRVGWRQHRGSRCPWRGGVGRRGGGGQPQQPWNGRGPWGGCRGQNPLFRKCKWAFFALKNSDLAPLLTILHAAGGAAAEACGPIKVLAAMVKNEANLHVLRRMKQAPAFKKLKIQMRQLHQQMQTGAMSMFAVPAALVGSDAWAVTVAHLREELPQAAAAVEKLQALFVRLQAELPMLLPKLLPALFMMGRTRHSGKKHVKGAKYKAKFIKDDTVPDGSIVAPKTQFTKTWTVSNRGKETWPKDTALLHVGGDMELRPTVARVAVGAVEPGKEHQLSVDLLTPPKDGRYWSYWRLVAGDDPSAERFGIKLWADVTVSAAAAKDDEVKMPKSEAETAAPFAATAAATHLECPKGHGLVAKVLAKNWCDLCKAKGIKTIGTDFRCSSGCDYDVCSKCAKDLLNAPAAASASVASAAAAMAPAVLFLHTMALQGAQAVCDQFPAVKLPAADDDDDMDMPGLVSGASSSSVSDFIIDSVLDALPAPPAAAADDTIIDDVLGDLPAPPVTAPAQDGIRVGAVPPPAINSTMPMPPTAPVLTSLNQWQTAVDSLTAMGFEPAKFQSLLRENKGNIQKIMDALLK